ncbi:GntR family transcriptional regulator [Actinokineospora iranica]|uniref:DNA-binding transcriptional regulator YhcF, GntR family n=1 Tax=Actinokineospora iranica TaxID=1271860 RepID=A0A1G6SWK2_9PSEU|nr:GntR family transcriptional regulator [Actinokineospora iranica]SDD21232.1 DNA-binding transcriptional regulator YhcF, GntR family [Actinokineospora iranica]
MITIDPESPVPPFEQVRSGLAQRINDHSLAVGEKLPTVRKLAADLGLAANTVARAYRELEEAGLVETRGRLGTFVGAGGDRTLERARAAADEYAATAHSLGLDRAMALDIVQAALRKT